MEAMTSMPIVRPTIWMDVLEQITAILALIGVFSLHAGTLRSHIVQSHCDVEPLTATDTAIMYRAFGNQNDWGSKGVYIRLPDVRWTIAGTRNFPHGTQTLKNNNFDGQNCVHFLRTMSQAERNDPKDGVKNQKCIRELWKKMTGQEIGEDIEQQHNSKLRGEHS